MVADIIFVVVVGGVKPVDNPRTRRRTRVCTREKLGITLPRFQQHRAKTRFSLSIFPPVPFDSFFFPFALFENLRAFPHFFPKFSNLAPLFTRSTACEYQPVENPKSPDFSTCGQLCEKSRFNRVMHRGTLGERPLLREKRLSPRPPLPKSGWRLAGAVLLAWFRLQVGCGFLHIGRVHGG